MWPFLLVWALGGGGGPSGPAREAFLVSAAVSLTEALTECGEAFSARTMIPVRFNFGPSNALARQIVRGAPVDLFVSADEAQMQVAVRGGAILASSVRVIATNQLVIIVPGRAADRWKNARPLQAASIRRIAIGDPNAVPAGVYAKEWLQRLGIWRDVEPKLVPAASVRGALSAVHTGSADAGFVYRTDVASLEGVTVAFEVTGPDAPKIEYPVGVVSRSPRRTESRAFVEFLRSPDAQRILRRRGFGLPNPENPR